MQTLDMGDKEQDDQYPSQSVAAQESRSDLVDSVEDRWVLI